MKRILTLLFSLLFVGNSFAQTVEISPSSPRVGNCYPFGNNTSWRNYAGFVYKNIPAFQVSPGDNISFDLGRINNVDIRRDIYFAEATTNGGNVPIRWVRVVNGSQTPENPRGNTVVGDYELKFTAQASFNFSGGGFIIAFGPGPGTDSGCEQVMVNASSNDPSGYFVGRFYGVSSIANGVATGIRSTSSIGAFKIGGSSDQVPPNVVVNPNITVQLDANGNAGITPEDIDNGTSDDSGDFTLGIDRNSFNCNDLGTNTVTLTATDASGNSNSATATVTVVDSTVPTVRTKNITVALDSNGAARVLPSAVDNGSVDNCAIESLLFGVSSDNGGQEVVPVNSASRSGRNLTGITYTYNGQTKTLTPANAIGSRLVLSTLTAGPSAANRFWDADSNTGMTEEKALNVLGDLDLGTVFQDCYDPAGVQHDVMFDTPITPGAGPEIFLVHGGLTQDLKILDTQGNVMKTLSFNINNTSSGVTVGGSVYASRFYGFHLRNNQNYQVQQLGTHGSSQNRILALDLNASEVPEIGGIRFGGGGCNYTYEILGFQPDISIVNQLDFTCDNLGDNTVTLQATDASGNISTETAIVTVTDELAPGIEGKPVEVTLTTSGTVSITPQDVLLSGSDNCGPVTYTLSQDIFGAADALNSPVTIQLTGTDPSNNATSVDVEVTVIDPVPVVITKNIIVRLDITGNASIVPEDVDNGSGSVVGLSGLSLDIDSFDCTNVGSPVTVTLTATSTLGSMASETAIVTVLDEVPPMAVAQDITVSLSNGGVVITPGQVGGASTDNCAIERMTLNKDFFTCSDLGDHVVTLTVVDVNGNENTATATVTVKDTTAPTAQAKNRVYGLDDNGNRTITAADVDNFSFDECGGPVTVTIDKTSFDCSNLGDNEVTLTVTDESGNISYATAIVTIQDAAEPEVKVRDYLLVELDATGNAAISLSDIDLGTRDNCGLDRVEISKTNFSCADVGTLVITTRAYDVNGNMDVNAGQTLVEVRDVTAPVFITRESFVVDLDANGIATITPDQYNLETVEDACGINRVAFDKTTFNCDEVGFHIVNVTAFDNHGNFTVTQADVEVRDVTAPTVITRNIVIDLDASGNASITPEMVDGGTFDNCVFSLSLNTSDFTCNQVGENVVELTAQDQNGVFASALATVTVRDIIAPTVLTKNITVVLDDNGEYTLTPDEINDGSTDNCSFTLSVDNSSFDCATLGENTVMLTATDASGNSTALPAKVTVADNAAPTIVANPITVQLDENGQASITASQVDGGTSDNCGVASVSIDIASFGCDNLGDNTVTITATDVNGNVSMAPANVEVVDIIAPTVGTRNISVELDESGQAHITAQEVLILSEADIETGEDCTVSAAESHAVWLSQYIKAGYGKNKGSYKGRGKKKGHYNRAENTRFVFDAEGGSISRNTDGTATVTGTIRSTSDDEDQWMVSLSLENARNWEEWSAMGRSYKREGRYVRNQYLNWTYYEMAEGSKLIGVAKNAGEEVALSHAPSDYYYGFQLGEAANVKNANFGLSGWFFYKNRKGKWVQGDFNLDVADCNDQPLPEGTVVTSDNCGIESMELSQSSFDCNDLGHATIQVTVADPSGNATTETAVVTVSDHIAPQAVAQNITISLGTDGTVSVDPTLVNGGSTDNTDCELTYTLSRTDFSCRDVGKGSYYYDDSVEEDQKVKQEDTSHKKNWWRKSKKNKKRGHRVTLTVTDKAGNTDHATAYITIVDDLAPTISQEPVTIVVYDRKREYLRWREVYDKVDDNCKVRSVWFRWTSFDKRDSGMNQVQVKASDYNGNTTWGTVNVEVVDISSYGKYVEICHRGQTRSVRKQHVQKWIRRGAVLGSCGTDIAMSVGGVNLNEATEREVTFEPLIELGAFPNPSQDRTTIKFSSQVAGPATVAVVSPNGVRLTTLFEGEIAASENVEVSYNTGSLPSGVYIVRLVTAGEIRNLKLMVRK